MKWKEKFSDYFWKIIRKMTPEGNKDKILIEINKLDENNPENFGKLAMMHYKLHNGYAAHGENSKYCQVMANIHLDNYKYFHQKWVGCRQN